MWSSAPGSSASSATTRTASPTRKPVRTTAEGRLVWLATLLLIGVSAGYGGIAVVNTLLMAAAGRAADLRLVRLAGATRRQVVRLVAAESALVVLIGAVLGGSVAFAGLLSIRAGLAEQVGAPVDLVVAGGRWRRRPVPASRARGVRRADLAAAAPPGNHRTRRMTRLRDAAVT